VESRVCQVSSTKRVLITGPEEGSRALPDKPGNEPVCHPLVLPLPDRNTGEGIGKKTNLELFTLLFISRVMSSYC